MPRLEPLKAVPPEPTRADDLQDAVARAQRGDLDAFRLIYDRCVERVNMLCRRMTNDTILAEQLTQDTFVKAWNRIRTFRGDSRFTTWLHRVAVRVVHDERRRSARRIRLHNALRSRPPPTPKGGNMAERIDLERAVAALPERARTVFLLHDAEGYTHAEIADLLDIAVGTSKSTLHRARFLLREKLQI